MEGRGGRSSPGDHHCPAPAEEGLSKSPQGSKGHLPPSTNRISWRLPEPENVVLNVLIKEQDRDHSPGSRSTGSPDPDPSSELAEGVLLSEDTRPPPCLALPSSSPQSRSPFLIHAPEQQLHAHLISGIRVPSKGLQVTTAIPLMKKILASRRKGWPVGVSPT